MVTPTSVDFLDWFSEDERSRCPGCGEDACVTVPDAPVCICLACAAVLVDGVRIDNEGRVEI
jgi:hypothetical protein